MIDLVFIEFGNFTDTTYILLIMRTLQVFLSIILALVWAHFATAAAVYPPHPMITPAPSLEKLEMRQSDCDHDRFDYPHVLITHSAGLT